jgi:hypothetical protein
LFFKPFPFETMAMASDPKYAKMKLVQIAYGEESEQINQQQAVDLHLNRVPGNVRARAHGLPHF